MITFANEKILLVFVNFKYISYKYGNFDILGICNGWGQFLLFLSCFRLPFHSLLTDGFKIFAENGEHLAWIEASVLVLPSDKNRGISSKIF